MLAARRDIRYRRGNASTSHLEVFSPKKVQVRESILDLILVWDAPRGNHLLQLPSNVENELELSAAAGEDRVATLWRLGCTGILHELYMERICWRI